MILFIYSIVLILFSIYSYSLIDVNLTLINHKYWTIFRNMMVEFGYYHRTESSALYLIFVLMLFGFFWYFYKNINKYNPLFIAGITGVILLFAYPFLSHDLFSYIFDAKVVSYYHQNPYLMRPQDFPNDQWLRFLHWTHRTYPYGPTFLVTTLIPSFIAGTKFILHFMLFKCMYLLFYLVGVWSLNKLNRKWAIVFATHPLVLIEGLMNNHNDLIQTSFALIGVYGLLQNKNIFISRLLMIYSAGIKFITFPLIFITKNKKTVNMIVFAVFISLMIYLSFTREIQPWYFLGFFAFIPFFEKWLQLGNIFFLALLIGNYFYVRYGVTNQEYQSYMKNVLLYGAFVINGAYIFWKNYIQKIPLKINELVFYGFVIIFGFISRWYLLPNTTQYFSPFSNINFMPSIFMVGLVLLIAMHFIPFFTKAWILLFLITCAPILSISRQYSSLNIVLILSFICIEIVLLIIFSICNNFRIIDLSKLPKFLTLGIFIVLIIIVIFGPIKYFSTDFGFSTHKYQKDIAGSIGTYKTIWEQNQKKNNKTIYYKKGVQIRIFPKSSDISGAVHLLQSTYSLPLSSRGAPFIICFMNACKKEYFMDGILKRGNLILPGGEKVSFDNAILIYEAPGRIEVYGFRWQIEYIKNL